MSLSLNQERPYQLRQIVGLILGVFLFLIMILLPTPSGMSPAAQKTLAITLLMASWWIGEAIHITATALIPLVAYPLLGIMNSRAAAAPYANHNVFLFMGGFFIAMAMQKWNLHQRIALHIINLVGASPRRLVLGFMLATAFLSMWISNTATTMMMLPIGIAVIYSIPTGNNQVQKQTDAGILKTNFGTALMLGIAYSASIGGVGTLIGTPPNVILAGAVKSLFPGAPEIGFLQWMKVGVPLVIVFLPLVWYYLVRVSSPIRVKSLGIGRDIIGEQLKALGPINKGERYTLIVFTLTALLWIFRKDIALGSLTVPGWSSLFPAPESIHDSTVAMLMALVLFLIPVDRKKGAFVLDWEWARRIPWGVLFLMGGGFALAEGFQATGLAGWVGGRLQLLGNIPPGVMVILVCLLMTFLTEVTSNTATTSVMMPVLAATALALKINPLLLMIPATISASCAFMLPVATPPNAIVFGSGYLTIPKMARTGLALNFTGILLVTTLIYSLALSAFGINLSTLPGWVK